MALCGRSVSVLVNYYSETSFLDLAMASVAPWVDEVVVVWGEYAFARPAFGIMGLIISEEAARDRFQRAAPGADIVWVSGEWPNELAKRAAGYERCRGDIVLRLDADEVLGLDEAAVARFVESDYSVAMVDVANMATHRAALADDWHDCRVRYPRHSIMFKRSDISPEEHLRYVWLVGEDPGTGMRPVFTDPVGFMYHATGPRSVEDHVTRVAFYQSLYFRTRPEAEATAYLQLLRALSGTPRALLARTLDGFGFGLGRKYVSFPVAASPPSAFLPALLERCERNMADRWSIAPTEQWPPGKYWVAERAVQQSVVAGRGVVARRRACLDPSGTMVTVPSHQAEPEAPLDAFGQVLIEPLVEIDWAG